MDSSSQPPAAAAPSAMMLQILLQQRRISFWNCFPILLLPPELRALIYEQLDSSSLANIAKTCTSIRQETETLRLETLTYYFDWPRHFLRPYWAGHMTMRHDLPVDSKLSTSERFEWLSGKDNQPMDLMLARRIRHLRVEDDFCVKYCSCAQDDVCEHTFEIEWINVLFPSAESITIGDDIHTHQSFAYRSHPSFVETIDSLVRRFDKGKEICVPLVSSSMHYVHRFFLAARVLRRWSSTIQSGDLSSLRLGPNFDRISAECTRNRDKLLALTAEEAGRAQLMRELTEFCSMLSRMCRYWPDKLFRTQQLPKADAIFKSIVDFQAYPSFKKGRGRKKKS